MELPQKISAKAKTKIILAGEHAVLYGSRAISLPIKKYTTVEIEPAIFSTEDASGILPTFWEAAPPGAFGCRSGNSILNSNLPLTPSHQRKIAEMIQFVLRQLDQELNATKISITINFSAAPGSGMGVSASLATALTRGLYEFFKKELSDEKLLEIVGKIEDTMHGKASGIDHYTIILDKPLLFQVLEQGELKITPLEQFTSSPLLASLNLIDSGQPLESTKEMVDYVAQKFTEDPKTLTSIFQNIDSLIPIFIKALEHNDKESFGQTINKAGTLLEDLGVVSTQTQKITEEIRHQGGSAKITGAGGLKAGSGMLLTF